MTLPSTGYSPQPGTTDSEYNNLRVAYEARGASIERQIETIRTLTEQRDRLQVEVDNLNAHLEADHEALRVAHAADDGPEVVYDWSQDEDSAEFAPSSL